MLKKIFVLLIVFSFFVQSIFAGFLTAKLGTLGIEFNNVLKDANFISVVMFLALFFGVYSLMRELITFAFKSHTLGQEKKAKNVIAFMVSFIGTSGMYFMMGAEDPKMFVLFFGGIFGLVVIILFSFLIMQLFISMANSLAPKENGKRTNLGVFWALIGIGSLLVAYMVLGFSGTVLVNMGCSDPFKEVFGSSTLGGYSCDKSTVFSKVFSWADQFIEILWTIFVLVIFILPFFLLNRDKNESKSKKDSKDDKEDKEKKSNIKKVEGALNSIKSESNKLNEASENEDGLIRQMAGYINGLESGNSNNSPGNQSGGRN